MRGDSVRDWYAKLLALAGLGALAAVGALVDYWPAAPRAAHRVAQVARVSDREVQPATLESAPPLATPDPQPAPRLTPIGLDRQIEPDVVIDEAASYQLGSSQETSSYQEAVETTNVTPAAPPSFDLASSILAFSPATELALSAPPAPEIAAPMRPIASAPSTARRSSDNRIVGAFKKTGSTIARGGMKTGSTIVSAFRAVGNALKKVV